jgi:hypothetical protein
MQKQAVIERPLEKPVARDLEVMLLSKVALLNGFRGFFELLKGGEYSFNISSEPSETRMSILYADRGIRKRNSGTPIVAEVVASRKEGVRGGIYSNNPLMRTLRDSVQAFAERHNLTLRESFYNPFSRSTS